MQVNIPFQVKLEAVYLDTLRGCRTTAGRFRWSR